MSINGHSQGRDLFLSPCLLTTATVCHTTVTVSPHHNHPVSPHSHRVSPHSHRVSPYSHRVSPHSHRVSPYSHRVSPHSHRVSPYSHRVSPHSHRVSPHSHRVSPHSHRVSPHSLLSMFHSTSPPLLPVSPLQSEPNVWLSAACRKLSEYQWTFPGKRPVSFFTSIHSFPRPPYLLTPLQTFRQ